MSNEICPSGWWFPSYGETTTTTTIPLQFLCGVAAGVLLTLIGLQVMTQGQLFPPTSKNTSTVPSLNNDNNETHETDYETHETDNDATRNMPSAAQQVLNVAIQLFQEQTKASMNNNSNNNDNNGSTYGKVVDYLSPEEMLEQLFASPNEDGYGYSLKLDHPPLLPHETKQDANVTQTTTSTTTKVNEITECFRQIQKFSINTNHPYFFNQLFGAVDPVALAAEIVGLSVHTSAATYETAPVFTLIEREVIQNVGRCVFSSCFFGEPNETVNNGSGGGDVDVDGNIDGLMLPGGSLSNLMALHVARQFANCTNSGSNSRSNSVVNPPFHPNNTSDNVDNDGVVQEEKKESNIPYPINPIIGNGPSLLYATSPQPELVAFVSTEAHYSFVKAASVIGIKPGNLVLVPTLPNGQMDIHHLELLMIQLHDNYGEMKIPFFVGITSGSTVRGSFDDIEQIVTVCRNHEHRLNGTSSTASSTKHNHNHDILSRKKHKIWIHVDGAWGGPAIFSLRSEIRGLMKGVHQVDSFTFNPHKMFGAPQQTTAFVTRHQGALKTANSSGAKYLFDCRKDGAHYDLGDGSFTCARRTDSIKLWALWKFYGPDGLGRRLDEKVDILRYLSFRIQQKKYFLLACDPWPFNVNFFFIPPRLWSKLVARGVDVDSSSSSSSPQIPHDLSNELADVSVRLKLILHQNGEMMIPYQPISNQEADCFRIVLAGCKSFTKNDVDRVLDLMETYGSAL